MGKPIVYCHGCGKSLLEADFESGRASRSEDRPFCASCRKPEPVAKASAGTRRARTTSAHAHAVPLPLPRRRSASPLALAAAAGGILLAVAVLVLALSRGSRPGETPTADPLAELGRLASSGADPEQVLLKCDELRGRVAGRPEEARLREIERKARAERAERERDRSSRTEAALSRVRAVVSADPEFRRRSEVAALFAAAMKEAGTREADVEKEWLRYEGALETAARRAAEAAREEADRLAAAGDFEAALARIDRLPEAFRGAAPAKALEPRRREIEERLRIERLPPPPLHEASHVWKTDTAAALSDRRIPASSSDATIPRFTWYDRKGGAEWVTFGFPSKRTVSSCEVYWFDDTGKGECRVPESWTLQWLDGESWKDVRTTGAFGVERDRFNRVAFEPVVARALRITAKLRAGFSGGILEWTVPGTDDIPRPPPPDPPPSADLVLEAAQARVQGERIAIKERDGAKYVGNWHRPGDVVEFTASVARAGRYRVELEYAASPDGGGEVAVRLGTEHLEARLSPTGDWRKFTTIVLGEVTLPAGPLAVRLQGKTVSAEGLMNLRRLRLQSR